MLNIYNFGTNINYDNNSYCKKKIQRRKIHVPITWMKIKKKTELGEVQRIN